ncbi:Late embryogenesis abundant protein, LEA-14 [Corchorus olitorius]|uniref:Late embryogenesis abundant protein, LEA-14 n=1 Tax=Corchorus olitorius TaxID=93759 RepID=A0A1R3KIP0_9ROSI|nr:Late embryogenesis abundant protein, LEA-14 [Corchorus olitorius]
MLSPPPPPPPPPPFPASPSPPLPPRKQTSIPVSVDQVVISKPFINQQTTPTSQKPDPDIDYNPRQPILRPLHTRRTNPLIWCCAILCLIFSIILILFGVATLIIFVSIKPRVPAFDTPNASLNGIYFDSPEYFNGDFTVLANFSNPNRRIDVRFEYLVIDLFFQDRFIGTQAVQPFFQRRGEARVEAVHFISSLVYLPQNLGVELQKQVLSNGVKYSLRGSFKVRANLGLVHFSYWLHSRCELMMSSPPTGVLVSHNCKTKR